MGAYYGKGWEDVTLIEVYDDGAIRCAWDRWGNVERDMARGDVIIAQSVLKKLAASRAPRSVERVWVDVTGKYKVEATYVDFKDGKVTLRRSDGKEVDVDVEKLSAADRKLVRELAATK